MTSSYNREPSAIASGHSLMVIILEGPKSKRHALKSLFAVKNVEHPW